VLPTAEGIRLRPVADGDSDFAAHWLNDSRITPAPYPVTVAAVRRRLQRRSSRTEQEISFTLESVTGAYLGEARLFGIDAEARHAELGVVVADPDNWGRGIGRRAAALMLDYAFTELQLNRVVARVRADNPRSLALCEGLGFAREARLRARFYRRGQYVDCVAMSIARADWAENTKGGATAALQR